jgi:lysozyme
MDISKRGLDLIKSYEGYSDEAYLCPENVWTIGWGSTRWSAQRPVRKGDTCIREQAEELLRREIWRVEEAIDQSIKVPLTQGQFDALVSWGYNVGIGWINGKREGGAATLVKYLNKGQYHKVPAELLKFKKGANSKRTIDGLLKRRKREVAELWLGDYGTVSEEAATPIEIKPTVPDVAPMPQAVIPEQPSTGEVISQSRSIHMSILGLALGAFQQIWEFFYVAVKEVSSEAIHLPEVLTPLEALFRAIGANMVQITAVLIAMTFIAVIARKILSEKA